MLNTDQIIKEIEKMAAQGTQHIAEIQQHYQNTVISSLYFGRKTGPFHAASIMAWTRLADLSKIPFIPVKIVAHLSMEDVWKSLDNEDISEAGKIALKDAKQYADQGGFWRTDLCASEDVKYYVGSGKPLPDAIPFLLDDCRIMDLHTYVPTMTIIGRPRITPMVINGYPVEFRVFLGGKADPAGAVSFYYPQAPLFEITPDLRSFMDLSLIYGQKVYQTCQELGLIPWLPEKGDPNPEIGATLDFMVDDTGHLLMVDAGPGYGYGAHPCCFLDRPVTGKRWRVDAGVKIR